MKESKLLHYLNHHKILFGYRKIVDESQKIELEIQLSLWKESNNRYIISVDEYDPKIDLIDTNSLNEEIVIGSIEDVKKYLKRKYDIELSEFRRSAES
jgi:hypothetical protein